MGEVGRRWEIKKDKKKEREGKEGRKEGKGKETALS